MNDDDDDDDKLYVEMNETEKDAAVYDTYLSAYTAAITGGALEEESFDDDELALAVARALGAYHGAVKASAQSKATVCFRVKERLTGSAERE